VLRLIWARIQFAGKVARMDQGDTVAGPGRVDAFTTALNLLFDDVDQRMDAPVSYPHLWGTHERRLVHWDNDTNSIMGRNIGQAIGLGAIFDKGNHSTLLPKEIHDQEKLLVKMTRPKWPFGPLNAEAVARGEQVYRDHHCANCHDDPKDARLPTGTDRERIKNLNEKANGEALIKRLGRKIDVLKLQAYQDREVTAEDQREMEGERLPPEWLETDNYGARPLAGVWARAPYLHNNSVPTLAALLEPGDRRPRRFTLDGGRYDVKNVGLLVVPEKAGLFVLDTDDSKLENRGNSNRGHEYGTIGADKLSDEDKKALLEYMKSL
jgi:hypothetical protein